MNKPAIRLLPLAMCATALLMVPTVTPAKAATHSQKHMKHKKKVQKSSGDSWSAGRSSPVARPSSQSGEVCPGISRSFECRTWPPPFDEDPDRKVPGRF
jgi:hypothetical protein